MRIREIVRIYKELLTGVKLSEEAIELCVAVERKTATLNVTELLIINKRNKEIYESILCRIGQYIKLWDEIEAVRKAIHKKRIVYSLYRVLQVDTTLIESEVLMLGTRLLQLIDETRI